MEPNELSPIQPLTDRNGGFQPIMHGPASKYWQECDGHCPECSSVGDPIDCDGGRI